MLTSNICGLMSVLQVQTTRFDGSLSLNESINRDDEYRLCQKERSSQGRDSIVSL